MKKMKGRGGGKEKKTDCSTGPELIKCWYLTKSMEFAPVKICKLVDLECNNPSKFMNLECNSIICNREPRGNLN